MQPNHVSMERHDRRGDEGAAVGPVVNRAMVVGGVDADIVGSGAERLRRPHGAGVGRRRRRYPSQHRRWGRHFQRTRAQGVFIL